MLVWVEMFVLQRSLIILTYCYLSLEIFLRTLTTSMLLRLKFLKLLGAQTSAKLSLIGGVSTKMKSYNKALLRKIYSLALLNFRRARRYESSQGQLMAE